MSDTPQDRLMRLAQQIAEYQQQRDDAIENLQKLKPQLLALVDGKPDPGASKRGYWTSEEGGTKLLEELDKGPVKTKELSKRLGVVQPAIYNALKALRDAGKVTCEGRSGVWSRKGAAPTVSAPQAPSRPAGRKPGPKKGSLMGIIKHPAWPVVTGKPSKTAVAAQIALAAAKATPGGVIGFDEVIDKDKGITRKDASNAIHKLAAMGLLKHVTPGKYQITNKG